jgi:glucokinase
MGGRKLMLLAGDIGGTKILLGLYEPDRGARQPITEAEFHSAEYPNLEKVVSAFLGQVKEKPEYACFGLAGPVIQGRATLTNLPWSLSETELAEHLGLRGVVLLNDLKAIAHAVPHLEATESQTINTGSKDPNGAMAVIAPGTGLGEGFLVWNGSGYIACSSEGGHADFSPNDATQAELWRYMSQKFGHVSWERVCSGQGIANIYDFFRDSGYKPEPSGFAARLAEAADPTPVIVQTALTDPAANPLCTATLRLFVAILGAEAGNLALKVLATGGVYLAGGIPKRVLPWLEDGRFLEAFVSKGRFTDLVQKIPVHVVTARAALLGAIFYGFQHFGQP